LKKCGGFIGTWTRDTSALSTVPKSITLRRADQSATVPRCTEIFITPLHSGILCLQQKQRTSELEQGLVKAFTLLQWGMSGGVLPNFGSRPPGRPDSRWWVCRSLQVTELLCRLVYILRRGTAERAKREGSTNPSASRLSCHTIICQPDLDLYVCDDGILTQFWTLCNVLFFI
jgi:hypothetical protein